MISSKSIIYALHGYIAVGKTTLAKRLEKENSAIRFSIDEWVLSLYIPTKNNILAYNKKVKSLIYGSLVPSLIQKDINIVLDFAFWKREERDELRELGRSMGTTVVFYFLKCDPSIAFERYKLRPDILKMDPLTWQKYNYLQKFFEPMTNDEKHILIDTSNNSP